MSWKGHVEPVSGILRVFKEELSFGDPYTMRWIDHETVELAGVDKTPKASMWRTILRSCRDAGAHEVIFYRHGVKKTVRVTNRNL